MMLLTACSIFDGIIDVIQAICSVFNLGLLIYFTKKEWKISKERDQEQKKDQIELAKFERKRFWYEKMMIEGVLNSTNEYFGNTYKCLDTISKDKNKQDITCNIAKIKQIHNDYKRIIFPTVKVFSNDLAKEISRLMQELQDEIMHEIEENKYLSMYTIEKNMNEKKYVILTLLHEYDFSNNFKKD